MLQDDVLSTKFLMSNTMEGARSERSQNTSYVSLPGMARRPSRSPAALARVRVKNRRKRYLDMHPEYFSSPSLELAGPLL